MANLERLKLLRETVIANPDKWEQRNWAKKTECGTTLCFAGWAVTLKGEELFWGFPEAMQEDIQYYGFVITGTLESGRTISSVAQAWLDLDYDQADKLFYSDQFNGLDHLNELIAETELEQENG